MLLNNIEEGDQDYLDEGEVNDDEPYSHSKDDEKFKQNKQDFIVHEKSLHLDTMRVYRLTETDLNVITKPVAEALLPFYCNKSIQNEQLKLFRKYIPPDAFVERVTKAMTADFLGASNKEILRILCIPDDDHKNIVYYRKILFVCYKYYSGKEKNGRILSNAQKILNDLLGQGKTTIFSDILIDFEVGMIFDEAQALCLNNRCLSAYVDLDNSNQFESDPEENWAEVLFYSKPCIYSYEDA